MFPSRRSFRLLALFASAGVVFQLGGCAAGLVPAYLGFLESAVFISLVGRGFLL